MSKRFASLLAGALLSAAPLAALAQATAPPTAKAPAPVTVAPVTVTASQPKTIEKQAQTFVQGMAAVQNPEVGQIARWYDPVCVQVVGLPNPDDAARIKARIDGVAKAVGLPKAAAHCTANVEIVFTPWPQLTMDMVAKRRDILLGYFHVHNRNQLKTISRPIQSWYQTATRGEATGSVALAFSIFSSYSQTQTEVIDDPDNQPPNGCADSRISTSCLQSLLHNVFIVADSNALQGKDLGLVADYLVMLALAEPRTLEGCAALPSVIDVLAKPACAGRDPPDGLTPADAAYLTALYAADLRAKKPNEEYEISERMAKILIGAKPAGR